MSTAHVTFTALGLALDVSGGCLIAAAEIVPRARRARISGQAALRRLAAAVGIKRTQVLNLPMIGSGTMVFGTNLASILRSPPENADDETVKTYLLTQAVDSQNRLNALEIAMQTEPEALRKQLSEVQATLESQMDELIGQSETRYSRERFYGLLLVVGGGICQAVANLVV